jgi:hypothetical protein
MYLLVLSKNIETKRVQRLDSLFFDFIQYSSDLLIVVCEINVYAFTSKLDCLWRQDADIITDYELEGNTLLITDYDGSIFPICAENGAILCICLKQ